VEINSPTWSAGELENWRTGELENWSPQSRSDALPVAGVFKPRCFEKRRPSRSDVCQRPAVLLAIEHGQNLYVAAFSFRFQYLLALLKLHEIEYEDKYLWD
jgi:hypothetical protein